MIEIIERPQHKCEKCGCVFTFEKDDFKKEERYMEKREYALNRFYSLYHIFTFVECPICGLKYNFYTTIDKRYDE